MRYPTLFRALHRRVCALGLAAGVVCSLTGFYIEPEWRRSHRDALSLDAGWRFHLGESDGAQAETFDDSTWRVLDVPHDWSIEQPRAKDAPTGAGGGFAETGVGWYRRTFSTPADSKGQIVWLHFGGVYMNAEMWLNGHSLGTQPYGYSSFSFDITPHLKPSGENVLAVRVDNSAQPNSRWYSGSGIFRDVWLEAADAVHVVPHGVVVTTPDATEQRATVRVQTTVRNVTNAERSVTIESRVVGHTSELEAAPAASKFTIAARSEKVIEQSITLREPRLWTPDTPTLLALHTRVVSGEEMVDCVETTFGVRTVRVSAERGFELNGRTIKLNGACVHHDHGPLGAASFASVEYRRVRLLKAEGFNAVRTSHNPPAPAFLDACDRLGLLVMDETFDCWEKGKNPEDYAKYFKDWWQRDLDAMVLRDRNHPSVVMWSVGNEVHERGLPEGARLASQLSDRVRAIDTTRPVTAALNFPWRQAEWAELDTTFAPLDIAGYNYEHKRHADDHARVPKRVIVATESYQSDTFAVWALAQEQPYFIGDFVWTGIDYLGESGIGRVFPPGEKVSQHWEINHWPWYGAYCGDIDITGWRKPISHYRNIVWDRGEKLYLAVQEPTNDPAGGKWQPTLWALPPTLESWTWPGSEGKPLTIEVYSRHASVRLFLNDKLVGEKPTTRAEEFRATFDVPYTPGKLRAIGVSADGREAEEFTLETAGPAAGVRLRPDYGEKSFEQEWPTFLVAEIVDAQGRVVPTSNAQIDFSASDGAEIIAVGTGDLTSPEPYVAATRRAWHGRAIVIVRPPKTWSEQPKDFTVKATAPELGGASTSAVAEAPIILSP